MKKSIITLLSATIFLSACDMGPKQGIGGIAGGIGGGVLGSTMGKGKGKIATTIAGTLLGGLIGSSIGASMDQTDRMLAERSTQNALETAKTNSPVSWTNPDNGNSGTIIPVRTYQAGNRYCREYEHKVNVGGRVQSAYGTACRQPDGSWQIQS
jgi:surface antigen